MYSHKNLFLKIHLKKQLFLFLLSTDLMCIMILSKVAFSIGKELYESILILPKL